MPRLGSGAQRTSRTRRTIEGSLYVWVKDVLGAGGIVVREMSIIVLAVSLLAAASTTPTSAMSEDVRRRLAAGEVVVTDELPPGASETAHGGTAVAILRASPEQVWRVIVDYRGHPRYYPRVTSADVVEMDERRAIVHYRVTVGPFSFSFDMEKYPDPLRRRVDWRLAEGRSHGLFRENSGYWQVNPTHDGGASLVTYAIAVRTMLPAFLTAGGESASLTETMNALRKLVEAPR
jgi:ribosome-associated toxin RatA of RatAB toxin-antitoxin module